MRKTTSKILLWAMWCSLILSTSSCEKGFFDDGDTASGINANHKYLYVVENGTKNLLQLNKNLEVIKKWDLTSLVGKNDVRGVTCNEEYLWLSVSGKMDKILQLASKGDNIMVLSEMNAPPAKKGTIRNLAWDGAYLWALNSGSTSSNLPAQLFKIDATNNTVVATYNINLSNARGMTYVGSNETVYGKKIPKGLYITDTREDKVFLFDEKTTLTSFFDMPLHPRGKSFTSPSLITYSDNSFFIVNTSSSSGNVLYRLEYSDVSNEPKILDQVDFPFSSPTAMVWSNFDFKKGVASAIATVLPNTAKAGQSIAVTITGKAFPETLTANFGEGITVEKLTRNSSSEIVVNIKIDETAKAGKRNVVLTDKDGATIEAKEVFSIVAQNPADGFLMYCDNNDGKIRKIKIADGTVVDTWAPSFGDPKSLQGLEFYKKELWLVSAGSSDEVYQIDLASKKAKVTLPAPDKKVGTAREVAFDNDGNMWVLNSSSKKIYNISKADGKVIASIATPVDGTGGRGIVFVNNVLYACDKNTDKVYSYDASSKKWTEVFDIPNPPSGTSKNRYCTGMTWDGVNFWIANSTSTYDYLMQISPKGKLLQSIAVENKGDAKITGVAFTY